MASFTPAGSGGIPITANIPGITSPTVVNVSVVLANTEYSYVFPGDTKKFMVRLRNSSAILKLSFISGESGTTYVSVPSGCFAYEEDIQTSSITIYFQSTQDSQVLEIISWV